MHGNRQCFYRRIKAGRIIINFKFIKQVKMKKSTETLNPTATHRIHFEDKGQDFLYWDTDLTGLVLDSKPYKQIWVGCKVDGDTLRVGSCLEYIHPKLGRGGIKYKVVDIERLTQTGRA